jgi:hypothetical protein
VEAMCTGQLPARQPGHAADVWQVQNRHMILRPVPEHPCTHFLLLQHSGAPSQHSVGVQLAVSTQQSCQRLTGVVPPQGEVVIAPPQSSPQAHTSQKPHSHALLGQALVPIASWQLLELLFMHVQFPTQVPHANDG